MMQRNGFSLIELVVVIAVLGILGSVAIIKYVDFSGQSYSTLLKSTTSALNTASANNHMLAKAGATTTAINNCNRIPNLLPGGSASVPSGMTVTNTALTVGASATCTISDTHGNSQTFIGWGSS